MVMYRGERCRYDGGEGLVAVSKVKLKEEKEETKKPPLGGG